MIKIIDGTNMILGRLASYVAKEALKGEEIVIVNCGSVIISGNKKMNERKFQAKRGRVGSGQKGPKYSLDSEKIVKKTIRGMLPDHREGRGRIAFKKIKCYKNFPEKYQGKDVEKAGKITKIKYSKISEFKQ